MIFYSIVNPQSKMMKDLSGDAIYSSWSSDTTFQSVMYEHYKNITKIINDYTLEEFIFDNHTIFCFSNTNYDSYKSVQKLNIINCQSETVYYFAVGPGAVRSSPTWNILHSEFLTMKKFMEHFKYLEGKKITLPVHNLSTNFNWTVDNPNPPLSSAVVHRLSNSTLKVQGLMWSKYEKI